MKRVAVLLVTILFALGTIPVGIVNDVSSGSQNDDLVNSNDIANPSEASDSGNDGTATTFMSRTLNTQTLRILNSYLSPNTHSESLDLSGYLIPGWNLYNATIETSDITAVAEHESNGINPNDYISIENSSGLIFDALYQEFYNQPHDGKLNNYTFNYFAFPYDDSLGEAYLVVRSNFSDPNTNTTGYLTPFNQVYDWTQLIHDCSSDNAILSASTPYYVVIDGTGLQSAYIGDEWEFNTIYWQAQYPLLGVETGYHLRGGIWDEYDSGEMREAELDYTYTPWNTTSNSALSYSDPTSVNLQGNSSSLAGMTWVFAGTNVSYIEFNTNQAVVISYSLKLSYKKQLTATTLWGATVSGQDIQWNITTDVAYPAVSELRFLNISIPETRTLTGFYNSSYPSVNHGNYESLSGIVRCSNMGNETWTLTTTSRNYLTSIQTFDTSDDSPIFNKVRMDVDIDVNSTLVEQDLGAVVTGTANLTIFYSGSKIWSPSTQSVIDGTTHYLWDIGATATSNGLYTIEEFWSNGTEAGYRIREIILYYPTTLTPLQSQIDGFTESTIDISVDFDDSFTPQGLTDSEANLLYSFDSGANTNLTHQSAGTWTASISTVGKVPGPYTVNVYAEGYALENRSITIDVTLIHDTQPLTILWSNTNDISYVETTELSVAYNREGGAPITGASVNVTIGLTTWQLNWDIGSSTYKIVFNGTDIDPGFGSHNLTIDAGLVGFESQSDSTETLDVHEESTIFSIEWSGSTNITYVESVTLYVDYQMLDTTAIPVATVEVTIGLDIYVMNWNSGSGRYWYQFNGNDLLPGFGNHSLTIEANKFGYQYQNDIDQTLTISEESTTLVLTWSNTDSITYINSTTLIANFTDSNRAPVIGATVNVSVGTGFWEMNWNPLTFVYELTFNGTDSIPGFGTFVVTVLAGDFGFVDRSNPTQNLIVSLESTFMTITWSNTDNITFIEQTTLIVSFKMSNTTPITGATINATISGTRWNLTWDDSSGTYRVLFLGSDVLPGLGNHNLTIRVGKYGYVNDVNSNVNLTITEEPTTLVLTWSNTDSITYINSTTLIANFTDSNRAPVIGATVNVSVGTGFWEMNWNPLTFVYELTFNGTDSIPGFGTFGVTVLAGDFGFVDKSDSSQNLNLSLESTSIIISWSNSNSITFIEQTTLIVSYRMSNNSVIQIDATINVTIGVTRWDLDWDIGTDTYRLVFNGTDIPPGFDTHSLTIRIGKFGYVNHENSTITLTISEVPTSHQVYWSNTNSITYVGSTTLTVNYTMTDGSPVTNAIVNVSTGTGFWPMKWNDVTFVYELTFNGTDSIPGFGTHSLTIRIGKFGYSNPGNLTETITLDEEPTSMDIGWLISATITYLQSTTLDVRYLMSDASRILDASVTATINGIPYPLTWNLGSQSYQFTFSGSDNPPGIGIHRVTIDANRTGFISQSDPGETLIINEEPTSMVITWSNTNSITFVESTVLIINYTMTNGTPVTGATVNVTIGLSMLQLDLVWDVGSETYQVEFLGSDIPPGFGTHNLTIRADKFGYVNDVHTTETLILSEEPTSLVILWSNTENITYLESTMLSVSYRMNDTTPISGATLIMTIGVDSLPLVWHEGTKTYQYVFTGVSAFPGFGIHNLTIEANKTGYETQVDATEILTISKVPTTIVITWSNTNTITFIESTILIVNYTKSDGSPVTGALVNTTVGGRPWILTWDSDSKTYQAEFFGSDEPPGFGTYNVTIMADRFGYESHTDVSQNLTLESEPTSLVVSWIPGNDITYQTSSILAVSYRMNDSSPIPGAVVNVTIGDGFWPLKWSEGDQDYRLQINGSDIPPDLGTFFMNIQASKKGFDAASNLTAQVTLREELTNLVVQWANEENNPGFFSYTYLIVDYLDNESSPVMNAVLIVSINSYLLEMEWNVTEGYYQLRINGSDSYLGVGTNSITIDAGKYGYVNQTDSTEVIIPVIPTILELSWSPNDMITYVEHTTLRANYSMFNGTSVLGASVNVTINGITLPLTWSTLSSTYERTFYGSDSSLSITAFSILVEASKDDFQSQSNSYETLTIQPEPTALVLTWSNTNSITYINSTTLIANFTDSSGAPVVGATVNASVGTGFWLMVWNNDTFVYELTFNGTDVIPGFGTFGVTVLAGDFGFVDRSNSSQSFTRSLESTFITIDWSNTDNITFIEQTTLIVSYRMSNNSVIPIDATVNVTIGGTLWNLTWDGGTDTYRVTFYGSDVPPGYGTHSLTIKIGKFGYVNHVNSNKSLTITEEPTALVISWFGGDNITYFGQTTLSVQFIMLSNSSPISTGVLNATIGGVQFNLNWSSTRSAYEVVIYGNDNRLDYWDYDVLINASAYGYVPSVDTYQYFTIRQEDTYLDFDWVSSDTISYLDSTVFRIYYRYLSNHSPVVGALVSATYLSTWDAVYNSGSEAYEITFIGSDFPTPIPGTHVLDVFASKANHQNQTDNAQEITINKESTLIQSWWLDSDNTISFVENATIYINYSIAASGIPIVGANVTIRIGTTTWDAIYNPVLELYSFTFTGDMDPPGLGSYGLFISASYSLHEGYQDAQDNLQTLEIESASVDIDSYWIVSGTITYLQQTTLVVNYTLISGGSIPLAQVNVTINQTSWFALWDEASETYRLTFNGTDALPGLGFHELDIRANRTGFDSLTDSTSTLNITEEPTVLIPRWSNPHQNNITYFEYTYLFVDYLLVNTTPITFATVSVTIGSNIWVLDWDFGESAYGIRFNGTDEELGFGFNSLTITALKHGYEYRQNATETLELLKDPTSIEISWSNENDITYVESTTLIVNYTMSNSTPITTGTVTATIVGFPTWDLVWDNDTQTYRITFNGTDNPPGLGILFSVQIDASAAIFATQSTSETLTIREEPTTANASWTTATIDWTESIVLGFDYKDTYGRLIEDATQKTITINGSTYVLQGTNGTYWMEFDNTLFDLGHHIITVNISKFGYEFAVNASISFDIINANTDLALVWNTTIDYLGQIILTADYTYTGTGDSIPVGLVEANITIDGTTTLNLTQSGDQWTITLDGDYLDLGSHSVVVRAQAYGYNYAEAGETLTVNEVSTDTSGFTWTPSNLTIEYTDSLELVVEYTYAGGDVPEPAIVSVTINGRLFNLTYSTGAWRVTIQGEDIDIGIHDAEINAWRYGYELRTFQTFGINVTQAANFFHVMWEPWDLTATYIDTVNLTVIYTEDFNPIENATIQLYINGTVYDLNYSDVDEMWHFSIDAATIDLGVWNVTVTANKTGYADGYFTDILTVVVAPTTLSILDSGTTFYFDETTTVDIYYQLTNLSVVPGAVISFTLISFEQTRNWSVDHWSATLNGTELGVGNYTYTIITSAYGYETQVDTVEITVQSIPTSVIVDASVSIYARESVSFRFTYYDDRSSTAILASEFDVIWSEFYDIVTLPNNTYVITVGGNDFHVGNYTFQLTLGRAGFDNSTSALDIDVTPLHTQFIYETTFSQYENETLQIEVQVLDEVHTSLIDWAYVVIELEGVGYVAIYDSGNSTYDVTFRLPLNIAPGTYTLYLHAEAEDCLSADVIASLEVLAKSTYVITLDVLAEVQADSTISISVSATEDSQLVPNIPVTVNIIIHLSEGGQQVVVEVVTTNAQGLATILFEVPPDAIELEISASFQGSISEWPAEAATIHIDVTPAGTGGGTPIIADPLVLTIVTGGISLPLLALAFRRRRRRGGSVSASVSVAPVSPVTPPSSPLSEMQKRLRHEIIDSDEGVTRAELSRRLGPSASKIGAMVKDLLNSDSGFYEVREGSKKLIRFRK